MHHGQLARRARELQFHLLKVVAIDVRVAKGVDELSGLQTGHLRHHEQQQRVTGDVEWHAQEQVGAALIELQAQASLRHIELEQRVARWQRHGGNLGHVPCAHNHASRVGVVAQLVHYLRNLVDGAAAVVGPGAPLVTVDGPQVAMLVGPLVPDAHTMLLQIAHVGVAMQEP